MNILDLVRRQGIELRKTASTKGGEYAGPCPSCGGKDRFHVWPEQNQGEGSYWCRGCGKGGDAIQYLRDFEGLSFHQACDRLGRTVPDTAELRLRGPRIDTPRGWDPARHPTPEALWREKAGKFTTWCFEQIYQAPDRLAYLHGRGLTDGTITAFGLGWNPGEKGGDIFRDRESWGLSKILNEDTERPRPLWLPRGWTIPHFVAGMLHRVRIRRPEEARKFGGSYYVVPGSGMSTMLLPPAKPSHREVYVVVESELDAILLHQEASDICGVVGLGSASTRPDAAATERLQSAVHILVSLDADEAGAKASLWWRATFSQAETWPVPDGKDPGEAFKAGVNLREWILAGMPEGMRTSSRTRVTNTSHDE